MKPQGTLGTVTCTCSQKCRAPRHFCTRVQVLFRLERVFLTRLDQSLLGAGAVISTRRCPGVPRAWPLPDPVARRPSRKQQLFLGFRLMWVRGDVNLLCAFLRDMRTASGPCGP